MCYTNTSQYSTILSIFKWFVSVSVSYFLFSSTIPFLFFYCRWRWVMQHTVFHVIQSKAFSKDFTTKIWHICRTYSLWIYKTRSTQSPFYCGVISMHGTEGTYVHISWYLCHRTLCQNTQANEFDKRVFLEFTCHSTDRHKRRKPRQNILL